MTVIQLMYGNPVMNVKGICEQFHISDRTARKHMKEIEENHERYGDYMLNKPLSVRKFSPALFNFRKCILRTSEFLTLITCFLSQKSRNIAYF